MRGSDPAPFPHVEVFDGGGPPVLFLPGLGAATRYGKGRVDGLRERATLVLVDLLGFGRSLKPRVPYSLDRHLATLEPVVGGRDPPVVVAQSLGAVLALALAARRPELVRGLVLVSLPVFDGATKRSSASGRDPRPGDGWPGTWC